MSEDTLDEKAVINRFSEVATLAGIKGEIDEDGDFAAGFNLNDDRSQMVFARAIKTPAGPGVCVFSHAAIYKKGVFGGISKNVAIELLKRNEDLSFARYGVREREDEFLVVASLDTLIDTLDPDELDSAMWSVAYAADEWEQKAGQGDEF